jgi:hypothetical protein
VIDIPGETALRFSLKQGNVFYFVDESFSETPHLFIVINRHPETDDIIYFVSCTSKVDIQRRRCRNHPPETLVEIGATDYKELRLKTAINCNDVKKREKDDLVERVSEHRISFSRSPMPDAILKRIIVGVEASNVVEEKIKKLI